MHYQKLFCRPAVFPTAQADPPLTEAVDRSRTWKMDHFPRFPRRKKCSTAGSTATTSESPVTPSLAKAVTNADAPSDQMSLKCHKDGAHASTTSIVHTIVTSSSAPTATTPIATAPTTTTPSLGKQASASVRPPPQHKRNPFERAFRRTQKRARDASPASLPNSPATVLPMGYDAAVGPSPNMAEAIPPSATANENDRVEAPQRKPSRMPAFLELCEQDIGRKFDTLNWLERRRIALGDRDPRWQPVQDPCARFLDRYNNIWPWNNSRVRLQVPEGYLDYINASPITLEAQPRPARPATAATASSTLNPASCRDPERFIAMQGPKGITIGHAWRMVVEQVESPGVIVMLTETHEGPLEKCYPYFPRSPNHPPLELDRHAEFGDDFRASVRCEEIEPTPAGDAIELRKLVVRVYKQRGKRANKEHEEQSRQEAGCATRTAPETQSQQAAPGEDVDVQRRSPQPEKCSPEVPSTIDHDPDVQMLSPVKENASVDDTIPAGLGQSCNGDDEPQAFLPVEAELDKEMPSQPPQDPGGGEAQDYEDRVIWHLLYKKWPDYGVPDLADLDSFFTLMRLSREKNARPENPRVVHCSAGVGRSGTFIALDYLMRELDAGTLENWDDVYQQWQEKSAAADAPSFPLPSQSSPSLLNLYHPASAASRRISMPAHLSMMLRPFGGNGGMTMPPPDPSLMRGDDLIFSTVNRLREQRRQMVQAEMQYVFIYQVMRKLWQDRYCEEKEAGEPAAKRLVVDPFVEG